MTALRAPRSAGRPVVRRHASYPQNTPPADPPRDLRSRIKFQSGDHAIAKAIEMLPERGDVHVPFSCPLQGIEDRRFSEVADQLPRGNAKAFRVSALDGAKHRRQEGSVGVLVDVRYTAETRISIREAASVLGCSTATVRRKLGNGELASVRLGHTVRVDLSKLVALDGKDIAALLADVRRRATSSR